MHPLFEGLARHSKQLGALSCMLESNRLAHAFCFSGPDRAGKREIVERFASAVLGIAPAELSRHPDVIRVVKGEEPIGIDDIRGACERLSHTALLGTKLAIIEDMHLLHHNVQNALLKTLEEPSGRTVILLTADDARGVLPTVLSRTVHLQFPQVAADAVSAHEHLRNDVRAFIELPTDQRLMRAGTLVKGDDALDDDARDAWFTLLADELRRTFLPRGHVAPLKAVLEAREALRDNGNPTLAFENIAISLSV
ncbi:MAG: hypothetical protein NUV56_01510 [Candidatus Uhrbacteria bacterium]|nr:hypothetical protein [Candidatus Uhrbacteria bacterium]